MTNLLKPKIKYTIAIVVFMGVGILPFANFSWVSTNQLDKALVDSARIQKLMDSSTNLNLKALYRSLRIKANNLVALKTLAPDCQSLKQVDPTVDSDIYTLYPIPGPKVVIDGVETEDRAPIQVYCDFSGPYASNPNSVYTNGSPEKVLLKIKDYSVDLTGDLTVASAETKPSLTKTFSSLSELPLSRVLSATTVDAVLYNDSNRLTVRLPNAEFESTYPNTLKPLVHPAVGKSTSTVHLLQVFQAKPANSDVRQLMNMDGKVCLTSSAVDSAVRLDACSNIVDRRFIFVPQATGQFQIKNVKTGFCLRVGTAANGDGVTVVYANCGTGAAQLWRIDPVNPSNTLSIKSVLNSDCLDVGDPKKGDGYRLRTKACRGWAINQQWLDTARKSAVYVRNLGGVNATWSSWIPVTNAEFYPNSSPVFATVGGQPHFAVADQRQIRVYEYLASGKWREKLRTLLPYPSQIPLSLALQEADLGEPSATFVLGVKFRGDGFFVNKFSEKRYMAKWVKVAKIPSNSGDLTYRMAVQSLQPSAGRFVFRFPISGKDAYQRATFDLSEVKDPGSCSHIQYLKDHPSIVEQSFEAALDHWKKSGRANYQCRPYEETCTLTEYNKRLGESRKDPTFHYARTGRTMRLCRPIIPTCTVQEYYKRYPALLTSDVREYRTNPMAHFQDNFGRADITANTCSPSSIRRCTVKKYRSLRPNLGTVSDVYADYVQNGIKLGLCEPSIPKDCDENPVKCMGVSSSAQILTDGMHFRSKIILKSAERVLGVGGGSDDWIASRYNECTQKSWNMEASCQQYFLSTIYQYYDIWKKCEAKFAVGERIPLCYKKLQYIENGFYSVFYLHNK